MAWDALLLFIVGIFATVKISKLAHHFNSYKYLSYALAGLFFSLGQLSVVIESVLANNGLTLYSGIIVEFSAIIAVSLVLCGLAVFIRESKPVFAQFPLIYAALPLLLIISYWLVMDSFAIKEWLMSIYQGGALLVALMMYGAQSYRDSRFNYLLAASLVFTLTYVLYWFIPGIKTGYSWIWQIFLGISLIAIVIGFEFSIAEQPAEDI